MADHSHGTLDSGSLGSGSLGDAHPDMDMAEHERTYRHFLVASKWGTIAILVILVLMARFLL
jgi:hypothetical protein